MVAPSAGGSRLPWQRTPTTNPFLTNSKKIRRSKHVTNTHTHGRGSFLSDGTCGDSQSPVEAEPLRSKDRGLFTYNITRWLPGFARVPHYAPSVNILYTQDTSLEVSFPCSLAPSFPRAIPPPLASSLPPASFFFGVRIWLVKILGPFSINYFRGLGLRIMVRVWVMVRVRV